MKKVLSLLLILVLSITFVQVASADEGISALTLSCPAKVTAGETANCTLTGNIGANVTRIVSIGVQKVTGKIESVDIDSEYLNVSNPPVSNGVELATVNVNTLSTGGVGQVIVAVKYYSKNSPSNLLTITAKSREMKIINGSGGSGSGSTTPTKPTNPTKPTTPVKKNSTLKDLKVNGKTVSGFASNVKTYSMKTSSSTAEITATKASSTATVTGTGLMALNCGNNSFTVTVKNGTSTSKYTLKITRTCNTNAYLSDIAISEGSLSPKFNKNISNYTVKVRVNVEEITITGIKGDPSQTIIGNVVNQRLKSGNNKFKLTVVTNAGAKKNYVINVVKEQKDALLRSLTVSDGTLNFNKNKFDYNIEVLSETTSVEVLAIPEDQSANVTVTGNTNLQVGENLITIKVELQDAKTKIYTIKVNRLKEGESFGTNPNIQNIEVVGYKLKFNFNKKDYKLVINQEDALDIKVTMEDENATYEIIGNENLKNGDVIRIIGKASNGDSKEYTIEITKSNFTASYIIGGSLIALAILLPIVVYFLAVKKRKALVDANGNKLTKAEYQAYLQAQAAETSAKNVTTSNVQPAQTNINNAAPDNADILKPQAVLTDNPASTVVEQPAVQPQPVPTPEQVVEPQVVEQPAVQPQPVPTPEQVAGPQVVEQPAVQPQPVPTPEQVAEPQVVEQPVANPQPVETPQQVAQPVVQPQPVPTPEQVIEPQVVEQPVANPQPVQTEQPQVINNTSAQNIIGNQTINTAEPPAPEVVQVPEVNNNEQKQ